MQILSQRQNREAWCEGEHSEIPVQRLSSPLLRQCRHESLLNGYVINYTFCQKHQSIGKTPTEAAGLKIKGWKQLIEAATVQKAGGKIEEKQIIEEVLAR